jgi:hypothetical protein
MIALLALLAEMLSSLQILYERNVTRMDKTEDNEAGNGGRAQGQDINARLRQRRNGLIPF